MDLVDSSSSSQHSSIHSSRRSSWAAIVQNFQEACDDLEDVDFMELDHVDIASKLNNLHIESIDVPGAGESIDIEGYHVKVDRSSHDTGISLSQMSIDPCSEPIQELSKQEDLESSGPFHKWMRIIHRRAKQRPALSTANGALQLGPHSDFEGPETVWRRSRHRKSSSGSSFRFVSAVRSASASLASVSAVARSRRNTTRSQCFSPTDRSSRASGPRASEDSGMLETQVLADAAATERSLRRRKVLEELISTEEAYIGDVRFLMNVYVTILAALPSLCVGLRSSINRNLTEIVELHEEILGELHRVVPHSEYTQIDVSSSLAIPHDQNQRHGCGHRRWASLSAVPEHDMGVEWLQRVPGMLADPQVAAEVSKVFGKKINRFFIYEEYGATYEMMIKDIASAQQFIPDWETYQKGLEALAVTLGSARSNEDGAKKALTTNDLLVKPIQRVCKYPLLFSELLKYTPVSDCPNSHMEVDSTLTRLREATAEINRASDDVRMKETLEKTWLLQDRLAFPDRKLDAFSKKQIRSFGHIRLCGTLHVCWQTKKGVDGQYLICLLYRDVLCLASACKIEPIYTILACINANEIKIENVDNGRGLQCHTAPFSWKVVFECDHQLYELIMTACTLKEEMEWRTRLARPDKEDWEPRRSDIFSSLYLDMKSMGTVFGKPGTIARRMSIHRATTVGPKSPLCQVVLKNTTLVRDAPNNASAALTINRSQSLLTTNRVPVLAPARSERARLEALLADVWSREILPFPGMTTISRGEHLVRSSASVIRKLSVASIASSFTKRSGSLTQRTRACDHGSLGETFKRCDSRSVMDVATVDHMDIDEEPTRKAKRQRTEQSANDTCEDTGAYGTVRRMVRKETSLPEPDSIEHPLAPVVRAKSTSILLPRRSSSFQKTASPLPEVEKARKSSIERVRSLGLWSRASGTKNEGGSGLRKLFSIGRDF